MSRPAIGVKIGVRLPEELLARVDSAAEENGDSRAAMIRTLLEDALDNAQPMHEVRTRRV